MRVFERWEQGSELLQRPLDEYISEYNKSKGGFNGSRTLYRMNFSSEDVYLQNGSIIEHIHPFNDMKSGTFEEMIINFK